MKRPRVLIWAHLGDGGGGGVQTVISGLAQGFRELGDAGFDLVWFTKRGEDDWLRTNLPEGSTVVHAQDDLGFLPRATGFAARRLGRASEQAGMGSSKLPGRFTRGSSVRPAPVVVDLVHFTTQASYFTTTPFIYQPHDLQHEHYPEYFSSSAVGSRRMIYRANIHSAALTVVGSESTADDIKQIYPDRADHVMVVPLAPVALPPLAPLGEDDASSLPEEFALYPAAAWPHKNHATLFKAQRILKDRGLRRPVVLTGARLGQVDLNALARATGVEDLVTHLGFVDPGQLAFLYRRARLTVVPTLFEAGSFPMFEAFQSGCPVVASDVCSLPAQAAGAAVLIDPHNPMELADNLELVWTNDALRAELAERGRERSSQFSWRATAQGYAAAYRRALGLPSSPEDRDWEQSHAQF